MDAGRKESGSSRGGAAEGPGVQGEASIEPQPGIPRGCTHRLQSADMDNGAYPLAAVVSQTIYKKILYKKF